jgi:hypothetical protein
MTKLSKDMFNPSTFTKDDMIAFNKRYKNDPVLFSQEILKTFPDANQIKIIEAIRDNKFVSVASGRGIGKSVALSIIAMWTRSTQPGAKVLVTSNTDQQSKNTLWSPMVSLMKQSLISSWFDNTTELIYFTGSPEVASIKRLVWSESNVESVSGYHAKNMTYLCDESSAYPNTILANLYASCTEDNNRMLLTSNPTKTTGYYYDTFDRDNWINHEIDSRSSQWTNKAQIDEMIAEYGEDSDYVRVQVKGQFPRNSSSSIVSPDILSRSMNGSKPNIQANHIKVLGWDLAGEGGDANTYVVRQGNWVEHVENLYLKSDDEEPAIQKCIELCIKYDIDKVFFDKTGMGFGLIARIKSRLPAHTEIVGIGFAESSYSPDCYLMRSYIYKRLRDWFHDGGIIGDRPIHREQLLATEYTMDDRGRLKLIKKDLIKANISSASPDEADALALTCAYEGDLIHAPIRDKFSGNNLQSMMMDASSWG